MRKGLELRQEGRKEGRKALDEAISGPGALLCLPPRAPTQLSHPPHQGTSYDIFFLFTCE